MNSATRDLPVLRDREWDVPAYVVHEDDTTLALLDINPATEGHTLVVPNLHADDLLDADADSAAAVMRAARTVAREALESTAQLLSGNG